MKNTNKQPVELSYYRLTLQSFLLESHPELAANADFITARGDLAAETYLQVIKDGYTPSQAEEFANEVLYKDLNFSKHDTIVNILWNEFADEVPQGSAKELAQQLFPFCEAIFAKYTLTDDFAYELQFDQLYTELTGTIVLWLEDHELQ